VKRNRKSGEILRQTVFHPLGRLTLAGFLIDQRPTNPMPMRFWDTYAIVYVLDGRARFHDETGLSLLMRPGDLLLMFPGHGYHYDIDPRRPWSEFALHFQGPVFDLWRELRVLDPARPIYHLMPIDKWLQRFEALVQPSTVRRAGHVLKQLCQWQELLADIVTAGRGQSPDHPRDLWLEEATALLDKQRIDKPVDWESVAEQMGLSHDGFRKKFTRATGTSPARYVMARRLENACKMLEDRMLGLKEIARACGFCDAFQFSRQFKKGLRLSPTEYRQRKLRGSHIVRVQNSAAPKWR
jgi:AraC-like DNA-binding protein